MQYNLCVVNVGDFKKSEAKHFKGYGVYDVQGVVTWCNSEDPNRCIWYTKKQTSAIFPDTTVQKYLGATQTIHTGRVVG